MNTKKYHLYEQEIPKGYVIFEEYVNVQGIQFRKDDVISFIERTNEGWLEFEQEESSKHD